MRERKKEVWLEGRKEGKEGRKEEGWNEDRKEEEMY